MDTMWKNTQQTVMTSYEKWLQCHWCRWWPTENKGNPHQQHAKRKGAHQRSVCWGPPPNSINPQSRSQWSKQCCCCWHIFTQERLHGVWKKNPFQVLPGKLQRHLDWNVSKPHNNAEALANNAAWTEPASSNRFLQGDNRPRTIFPVVDTQPKLPTSSVIPAAGTRRHYKFLPVG